MVVADVGAGQVLVLHRRQLTANLAALDALDVGEHAKVAEVALRQQIRAQGRFVVGGQGDEVVEHAGLPGGVPLEAGDEFVGRLGQRRVVVFRRHQPLGEDRGVRIGGDVLAGVPPLRIDLLAERQGPVEGGRVVVHQLGLRRLLPHRADQAANLLQVGPLGFNPQQVGAVLQAGGAVEHHPVGPGALAEGVQAVVQPLRAAQLAVLVDGDVAVAQLLQVMHFGGLQKAAIAVAQIAWRLGHRNLHGQPGA